MLYTTACCLVCAEAKYLSKLVEGNEMTKDDATAIMSPKLIEEMGNATKGTFIYYLAQLLLS